RECGSGCVAVGAGAGGWARRAVRIRWPKGCRPRSGPIADANEGGAARSRRPTRRHRHRECRGSRQASLIRPTHRHPPTGRPAASDRCCGWIEAAICGGGGMITAAILVFSAALFGLYTMAAAICGHFHVINSRVEMRALAYAGAAIPLAAILATIGVNQ